MEVFFIVLAVIAGAGVAFFLFVIEPRRKIYDYDPREYDPPALGKRSDVQVLLLRQHA